VLFACLAALGCALCYGTGAILQSVGAGRLATIDGVSPTLIVGLARQLPYLIGVTLDLVGWLLSLVAVRRLPLFAVQAILAGSVGVTVLLAAVFLGSRPSRRQIPSLAALGAGVILLAVAARPGAAHPVSTALSWGIAGGVLVLAVVSGAAVRSRPGARSGALLGLLSGLAFGGTAVCARIVEADPSAQRMLADPAAWALLGYGALGLTTFAAALQRGSVTVAMAGQCAGETLLPAFLGVLLLGDSARPGAAPAAAIGFTVVVAAAMVLVIEGVGETPTASTGAASVTQPASETTGRKAAPPARR
jgi:drug/metabolite transporter (DMT)-like permease